MGLPRYAHFFIYTFAQRKFGVSAPSLIDLVASFRVNNLTNVLTPTIAASPNGTDISVRIVEELGGAAAECTLTTNISAATQLPSPRSYIKNGATAEAATCDCSGGKVDTDYQRLPRKALQSTQPKFPIRPVTRLLKMPVFCLLDWRNVYRGNRLAGH
jgi:hypothetical protein